MKRSRRTGRALVIGAVAALVAMAVAWLAASTFGAGSRSGGAIVGGSLVAMLCVVGAVFHRREPSDRTR